jgi:hypothetical protein
MENEIKIAAPADSATLSPKQVIEIRNLKIGFDDVPVLKRFFGATF